MFAQYSPLFNAGLRLADSSPSSSRAPSPQPQRPARKHTHDSLPLTVASRSTLGGVPAAGADDALFLTQTSMNGTACVRFAVGAQRTERAHVEKAWEIIRACAAEVVSELVKEVERA